MDKWTRKYLKLARTLADDNDACYSRKIGAVLVSDQNRVISIGYNGSVSKAPHTDSAEYLTYLYDDLLDEKQLAALYTRHQVANCQQFVKKFEGCKVCPRRHLGLPTGEGLEVCNCAHAEVNTLAAANQTGASTLNSTMYIWGERPVGPCHNCCISMVQAKVIRVVCCRGHEYSKSSRGLLRMSGVELVEVDGSEIDD